MVALNRPICSNPHRAQVTLAPPNPTPPDRPHGHTIGSDEIEVGGLHAGRDDVPLLRGGDWQLV
jgi:hypothetical protein